MAATDHLAKSARMLASIAVIVAVLYVAKGVLAPITLAVLLSFLLSRVCDWLERHWRTLERRSAGTWLNSPGSNAQVPAWTHEQPQNRSDGGAVNDDLHTLARFDSALLGLTWRFR